MYKSSTHRGHTAPHTSHLSPVGASCPASLGELPHQRWCKPALWSAPRASRTERVRVWLMCCVRWRPGYFAWRTVPVMASVLVVEDDQFVRSALIRHLTEASHTVRSVGTALEALREVAHYRFDVVILDLGLPDLDGSEALKMLRGITDVPVIIATARDDETEIVRLLNDGADDYLTKPFSVEHLSARMAAVLRRSRAAVGEAPPSRVIQVGGLSIDPLRRQAELDGRALDLTRREFDLLAFLAGRPGVVVPRKELLAEVWQQSYGDDQTIDVHLSWLRRKLGETAAQPRYLHTLRGVGVKLEPPIGPRQ